MSVRDRDGKELNVKLSDPPLSSLIIGLVLAGFAWILDAGMKASIAAFACGVLYALFYLVVKPRRD